MAAVILHRRAVLQAMFASLAVGLPLGTAGCSGDDPATEHAVAESALPPATALGTYFPDDKLVAAAEIGRRWLASTKLAATLDDQRALVAPILAILDADADVTRTVATLRQRVADDFARGGADVVLVDGWTLSITEVHLCVTAGLSSSGV